MSIVGAPTGIIDKNQKLKKWQAFKFFFVFCFFRSVKYCKKSNAALKIKVMLYYRGFSESNLLQSSSF